MEIRVFSLSNPVKSTINFQFCPVLDSSVVKKFGDSVTPIMAVEDQITQVLINITLNAVDAMAEKGGILTITTNQNEKFLIITIRDTGAGILKEYQKNIFEPFFSTKPEIEGSGLGLPVSYSIINSHKGEITFSSIPDKGSVFHIRLPIDAAPAHTLTPAIP